MITLQNTLCCFKKKKKFPLFQKRIWRQGHRESFKIWSQQWKHYWNEQLHDFFEKLKNIATTFLSLLFQLTPTGQLSLSSFNILKVISSTSPPLPTFHLLPSTLRTHMSPSQDFLWPGLGPLSCTLVIPCIFSSCIR